MGIHPKEKRKLPKLLQKRVFGCVYTVGAIFAFMDISLKPWNLLTRFRVIQKRLPDFENTISVIPCLYATNTGF